MSGKTRTEKDSMGEMQVPVDALYGATTARAVENFPIAMRPVAADVIHAFGQLKSACAIANKDLGKLDAKRADAIVAAADLVAQGKHDREFPVDVYQTGSGTSTNMNANEVIANLANAALGFGHGAKVADGAIHPNDHVNMGQSSNDTFPTAMCIAAVAGVERMAVALHRLETELGKKATEWDAIVKVGRTHLMDATPIRMGQVFAGFTRQVHLAVARAKMASTALHHNMPIGGTAVGTGINTHPDFARRVCETLTARVYAGHKNAPHFREAVDHVEAQSTKDAFVEAHGQLKTIAVSLSKIASDIRLLGSGPRCGIGELVLPAIQPGSSIMPGKENPVICESMIQVACRVIGNDAVVTTAGLGGVGSLFELNVAMPVLIDAFIESTTLLGNVSNVFVDKLLLGLKVNEQRCADLVEQSLMNITSLAPKIGYDNAAQVAKRAMKENKTIRQIVRELELMDDATLTRLLNFDAMTRPDTEESAG
ncbi:MAG: fumC [Phycisphaerales bacterium]|nr:fumC [Phycisphaerales bacterium]